MTRWGSDRSEQDIEAVCTCGRNDADDAGFSLGRALALCRASAAAACPGSGNGGIHVLTSARLGVMGFVGISADALVVAYRGSTVPGTTLSAFGWLGAIRDWLRVNLEPGLVPSLGGRVHRGFLMALDDTWAQVAALVLEHRAGRRLWLTGHSMGGAIAILAGQRFWDAGVSPAGVYTFGAPKVGDEAFSRNYRPPLFRVENRYDVVPFVPFSHRQIDGWDGSVKRLLAGAFSDDAYRSLGHCRWCAPDGGLIEPSQHDQGRRHLDLRSHAPQWLSDHGIGEYLGTLEAA